MLLIRPLWLLTLFDKAEVLILLLIAKMVQERGEEEGDPGWNAGSRDGSSTTLCTGESSSK